LQVAPAAAVQHYSATICCKLALIIITPLRTWLVMGTTSLNTTTVCYKLSLITSNNLLRVFFHNQQPSAPHEGENSMSISGFLRTWLVMGTTSLNTTAVCYELAYITNNDLLQACFHIQHPPAAPAHLAGDGHHLLEHESCLLQACFHNQQPPAASLLSSPAALSSPRG
jgi:hypothetical protein